MKKAFRILAFALVLVTVTAMLAACGAPAKDPDDAKAALEENDYVAVKDSTVTPGLLKIAGIDDVECVVSGSKIVDKKGEHVTILYFKDKAAAKDAWEDAKEYADKEKEDDASDWVVKRSGAMIYFGTSEGIKAAK